MRTVKTQYNLCKLQNQHWSTGLQGTIWIVQSRAEYMLRNLQLMRYAICNTILGVGCNLEHNAITAVFCSKCRVEIPASSEQESSCKSQTSTSPNQDPSTFPPTSDKILFAPTGALYIIMRYQISSRQATFSNSHSAH